VPCMALATLPGYIPRAPPPVGLLRKGSSSVPWRKNAKQLYDLLLIENLDQQGWPGPIRCLQWLPWCVHGNGETAQKLLVGSNCGLGARNYLYILCVSLPEEPGGGGPAEEVTNIKSINHEGPVNALSYNPWNPSFVATATVTGDALVFDLQAHSADPARDGRCRPLARLRGHSVACRSVAWSPHQEGLLLSGGADSRLCLWDLIDPDNPPDAPMKKLLTPDAAKPLCVHDQTHGAGGVHETLFHPEHRWTFTSVGADGRLCFWDMRDHTGSAGAIKPVLAVTAHKGGALGVDFAPHAPNMLATGGRDKTVRLWDIRQPADALRVLDGHKDDVLTVKWAREPTGLLASSGADKCVLLWDPRRGGVTSMPQDRFRMPTSASAISGLKRQAVDSLLAPELVFVHAAHEAVAPAIAWGQTPEGAILATAGSPASNYPLGQLQVWQPAEDMLDKYWQMSPGGECGVWGTVD